MGVLEWSVSQTEMRTMFSTARLETKVDSQESITDYTHRKIAVGFFVFPDFFFCKVVWLLL